MTFTPLLRAVRLHLQIMRWRHGHAWLAAALATVAAAGLELMIARTDRDALRQLRETASARASEATSASDPVAALASTSPAPDGQMALGALLRNLPAADEQLRRLAALAEAGPVTLARADYQRRPLAAVPLVQWQITQPIQATYPAVRRYVEAVMRELPHASLDEISAHRSEVGQGHIEARLRWSLWLPACDGPLTRPAQAPCAPAALPSGDTAPRPEHGARILTLVPREALLPAQAAPRGIGITGPASSFPARDLFAAHRWAPTPVPPSPPAPAASAPEPPVAPPPPYTYLGKKLQDDQWEVYVQQADRPLVLREGDTADAIWRVDRITPSTMTLTYLPLGQTRTLAIGDDR